MEIVRRHVTVYTPDKMYTGMIDVPNGSLRTIDIFNSSNIYWRDPGEKSFDDAILLMDASITLEGNTRLCELRRVQLRLSDVLFFWDALETAGDDREKTRAATLKSKAKEASSTVNIITHTRGGSFFYITGNFYGLFKSKSKQRYLPLTNPQVMVVIRSTDGWKKKLIPVDSSFVGISTDHIEACVFTDSKTSLAQAG